MAITTFSGDLSAFFAAGTTLEARPASNWPAHQRPPAAGTTPVGSVTASAASSSAGVLSLTGLADSTEYYVSDSAGTRYVRITTFPERQEVLSNQADEPQGYPRLNADGKVPWALLAGGAVNVKDAAYGAKGDADATAATGTDDTAAINAAITAATSGATVFIPRGYYKLTSALVCDRDDITLQGEGGTRLVLAAGSGTNAVRCNTTADNTGLTRRARFAMRDLYIDHQGVSQASASGIAGCVVVFATDHVQLENVYVKNARDTGFDVRGCLNVRIRGCTADGVLYALASNGFNLGGTTSKAVGRDYVIEGCEVFGPCDVGIWLGSIHANRIVAHGNVVRSPDYRVVTDGAITTGTAAFTSATAAFTANDVGKPITVAGAGAAGAALTTTISAYTSATAVTLSANAGTTVTGATTGYGFNQNGKTVLDGAITSGAATLTSASATFTASDVGKFVAIAGAGAAGGLFTGRITAFTNSTTVTVSANAGTTVSGASVTYGYCNSGILAEGGAGNSIHLSIANNVVEGTWTNGIGLAEGSGNTLKHELSAIVGNVVANAQAGNAIAAVGNGVSVAHNVIDGFKGNGILLGGNDYDEAGIVVEGNVVKADPAATGSGIFATKAGGGTNYLHGLVLSGNRLNGNGGGTRGISLTGKLRNVVVNGNSVTSWKNSGIVAAASGGSSPSDLVLTGNACRNNNQAVNALGVNSVGIAVESACDGVVLQGNRCTDDQGSKTQTHGIRWASGALNGVVVGNDCRGNLTAGFTTTFDAGTIASRNLGWSTVSVTAASNIVLTPGDLVRINGNTQIDTITVAPDGTTQTMRFAGTPTVKNSATLKLSLGLDFSATADDTLTIVSDGTAWREVARSVN